MLQRGGTARCIDTSIHTSLPYLQGTDTTFGVAAEVSLRLSAHVRPDTKLRRICSSRDAEEPLALGTFAPSVQDQGRCQTWDYVLTNCTQWEV